jgi:GNAT superfamily N-acetyltransferase
LQLKKPRIARERGRARAVSRFLWNGLIRYNRSRTGMAKYERAVLSARDARGRVVGGVIVESYYRESYVELLWVDEGSRHTGLGSRLIEAAVRRARRRGSRLIHLNTYSFQAPRFYEKLGFRRFGGMRGSPPGASRHYYVKRLVR